MTRWIVPIQAEHGVAVLEVDQDTSDPDGDDAVPSTVGLGVATVEAVVLGAGHDGLCGDLAAWLGVDGPEAAWHHSLIIQAASGHSFQR